MSPNILAEARLLGLSILTGCGLAAVYAILQLWRRILHHNWIWVGAEDVLFWLFSGFTVFGLLYRENDGALRLYVIGTILFSMAVGEKILDSVLQKVLKKLARCFRIRARKKRNR